MNNANEDDEVVVKDKKFNVNNFNKLCVPEDYMPDDEEEEEGEKEEKVEAAAAIEENHNITQINSPDEDVEVKKIKDQLENPKEKLSKKDKRRLKKKLKKLSKKNQNSKNDETESDDSEIDTELNLLNLN